MKKPFVTLQSSVGIMWLFFGAICMAVMVLIGLMLESLLMIAAGAAIFLGASKYFINEQEKSAKQFDDYMKSCDVGFLKKYVLSVEIDVKSKGVATQYLNEHFQGWTFG